MSIHDYLHYWYPLPMSLPVDVQLLIIEFVFDPMTDPW
jgi:hypothetical protein